MSPAVVGRLAGRVAMITGAAQGIGLACARRFVAEGAKVMVVDVKPSEGEKVVRTFTKGEAAYVRTDVSKPSDVEEAVAATVRAFGRLDIVVNNAAIYASAPLHEYPLDEWDRIIAINLSGVFYGMRYGIAQMLQQGGGGCVLNVSSISGLVGFPGIGPYAASKGGVIQLTRAAAVEYGPNRIRVNAVCPAAVQTPMLESAQGKTTPASSLATYQTNGQPLGGVLSAEEIASAAAFLCATENKHITGVVLPVDGGFTIS